MRRAVALSIAVIIVGAGAAAARDTVRPQFFDELRDAGSDLALAPGQPRALVVTPTGQSVVDTTTRSIVRHYDLTHERDNVPSGWSRRLVPVMRKSAASAADRALLIDPMSGTTLGDVHASEQPLLVIPGDDGGRLITHNDRSFAADQQSGPHLLFIRRPNDSAPIATIELGPDVKLASAPSVAMSADGRLFALSYAGQVRLIDGKGNVRAVALPDGVTSDLAAPLFTDRDSRLVVAPKDGPLLVFSVDTLKQLAQIEMPRELSRRFALVAHANGQVLAVNGRRSRAMIDIASGKSLMATRGSSGSHFALNWHEPDLAFRASHARGPGPVSYGTYKRGAAGFKLLHKREIAGRALLAVSPNGACLFVSGAATTFRDLVTDRELRIVDGMAKRAFDGGFTFDGRMIVATEDNGRLMTIAAPAKCLGKAKD